jgi:hypothetical protein
MKLKDITLRNIGHFIEGYAKLFGDEFGLLPNHIKEQVTMRAEICKDTCLIKKQCNYCGCSTPGKLYVKESCNNGELFPDLMDEARWEEYKRENNIKI